MPGLRGRASDGLHLYPLVQDTQGTQEIAGDNFLYEFKAPASPARAAPLCGFAARGAAPTRSAYLTDECQRRPRRQRPGPARRSPPDTPSTPTVLRPPAPHQGRLRRRSAMEHAPPLTRHHRPDDRQLRGLALRLDAPAQLRHSLPARTGLPAPGEEAATSRTRRRRRKRDRGSRPWPGMRRPGDSAPTASDDRRRDRADPRWR